LRRMPAARDIKLPSLTFDSTENRICMSAEEESIMTGADVVEPLKTPDDPLTNAQEVALHDILSHCPKKRESPCWAMGALGGACPKCWECAQIWCWACDDAQGTTLSRP